MTLEPHHWGEVGSKPAEQTPASNDFDLLCARIFKSNDGRKLLEELRRRHFDMGGNPLADERALRVRATQQHFVRELEMACERGSIAAQNRMKK